jgi:putative glutamine amidotransferase
MINILTLGPSVYGAFIVEYLLEQGINCDLHYVNEVCYPTDDQLNNTQLVIFTGGEDVSPSIYGHQTHQTSYSWIDRDLLEKKIFKEFFVRKTPMLGICRGSQFLWAMNGGKLFQNVERHAGIKHAVLELSSGTNHLVNSTHHQMADISTKPAKVDVLAVSNPTLSSTHIRFNLKESYFEDIKSTLEVEAWVNSSRKILGIQWHPESNCPSEGKNLSLKYIKDLINA